MNQLRFVLSLFFLFLGGFFTALGLMVQDELLTLALYCGIECGYKIPLLGTWQLYDAESVTWAFVGVGTLLSVLSIGTLLSELYKRPPHG